MSAAFSEWNEDIVWVDDPKWKLKRIVMKIEDIWKKTDGTLGRVLWIIFCLETCVGLSLIKMPFSWKKLSHKCNSFKVRFSSEIKGEKKMMKNQHRRDEKSVSKYHGI